MLFPQDKKQDRMSPFASFIQHHPGGSGESSSARKSKDIPIGKEEAFCFLPLFAYDGLHIKHLKESTKKKSIRVNKYGH